MPSTYTVDTGALADSAPKFDTIAQDCVTVAERVTEHGVSLCDSLGDPAVVTAAGSAITTLLGDLRLVHGGIAHLAAGVAANAQSYAANEQSTAGAYARTGKQPPYAP